MSDSNLATCSRNNAAFSRRRDASSSLEEVDERMVSALACVRCVMEEEIGNARVGRLWRRRHVVDRR